MKPSAIILVFFLTISLFPQTPQDLIKVSVSEKEMSEFQIHSLIRTLEKSFNESKDLISNKIIESNEKEYNSFVETDSDFHEADYLKIRLSDFDFLTSNTVSVLVTIELYKEGSLNEIKTVFLFKKRNQNWYIVGSSLTNQIVKSIRLDEGKKHKNSAVTATTTIIEKNQTLIPMKFISDPDIWELNKYLAEDNLGGKQLFSESAEIDANIYFYGDTYSEKVFLLVDPVWARIIYVKQ